MHEATMEQFSPSYPAWKPDEAKSLSAVLRSIKYINTDLRGQGYGEYSLVFLAVGQVNDPFLLQEGETQIGQPLPSCLSGHIAKHSR